MAAVLACGARAVTSHRSAAALWGLLPYPRAATPVSVAVVGGDPRRRGIEVHRVRRLDRRDRRNLHGIPVTSPARTVLDLATTVDVQTLERVVAQGIRIGLFTERDLRDQLDRNRGRAGTAALRSVLERAGGPKLTRSEAERVLLIAVRKAGLPEPEVNATVCGYEVDFLWRGKRLVVERSTATATTLTGLRSRSTATGPTRSSCAGMWCCASHGTT
jgi:hypothetical protein